MMHFEINLDLYKAKMIGTFYGQEPVRSALSALAYLV